MEVLKEQFEASGAIQVNLHAQEWSTYIGAVLGGQDYPISFLGWFYDYPDPDNYMSPFIQNGGLGTMVTDPDTGEVIEGLDPALLDLLVEAATTPGTDTREELYQQLQEVYAEAVTTLPLWIEPEHVVFRDGVVGSDMYPYPEALNIGPTTEFNYQTLDTE
jgi:peptide/nickel transport system substrate-binding protein